MVHEEDDVVGGGVQTLHVAAHEDVGPAVVELEAVLGVLVRHQDLLVRVAGHDGLDGLTGEQRAVTPHRSPAGRGEDVRWRRGRRIRRRVRRRRIRRIRRRVRIRKRKRRNRRRVRRRRRKDWRVNSVLSLPTDCLQAERKV